MKRLLFIPLFFCLAFPSLAMSPAILGGAGGAAATCTAEEATNEIGSRADPGSYIAISQGYIICTARPADISGVLKTAYLYHYVTDTDNALVTVYSTTGSAANPGTDGNLNILLSTSGIITSSTSEWANNTMGTEAEVVNATNYWVCVIPDTTNWYSGRDTSSNSWYKTCAGCYATPPSNLAGTWTEIVDDGRSMYVTIGCP